MIEHALLIAGQKKTFVVCIMAIVRCLFFVAIWPIVTDIVPIRHYLQLFFFKLYQNNNCAICFC